MVAEMSFRERGILRWAVGGFLACRLVFLLASPLEGLRGYGDFFHFYSLAEIPGWPYFNYWIEFPPIPAFVFELLYRLAGGQQHVFDYLLYFLITVADALNLVLFWRLLRRVWSQEQAWKRLLMYGVVLVGLAYCWWYFDALAVLPTLLGLVWLMEGRTNRTGLALGIGILVKFFPAMVLVAAWKFMRRRDALRTTFLALILAIGVYALLWVASPDFTLASLISQGSKGSWETIWAMLDGNYRTGNFGPVVENLDPSMASVRRGNQAVVPPWAVLISLGALGLWRLIRVRGNGMRQWVGVMGLTWSLFFLWSPGWSTQWVLYLLPWVILCLDERQAVLLAVALTMVNLMEWPLLLSRGWFWSLPLTVGLRTLLLILLVLSFDQIATNRNESAQKAPIPV